MAEEHAKETHVFQTEVSQLLDLMIHSLYSNKEIFLRELISNASDAADKLRFEALSNEALYENSPELEIKVTFDKEAGTVTIADSGIGMTRDEVIANVGTIARSGTKEFLKNLSGEQAKDTHLIGQFGVGFYSAFIVADKVTLVTRKAGEAADQGVRWESAGTGDYTLEPATCDQRGTAVTLHLRDDEKEFVDHWRLSSTIRKFSDHVSWPIMMVEPPKPDMPDMPPMPDEEGKEEEAKTEEAKTEDAEVVETWEKVNAGAAIWVRTPSEVKEEEYNDFYKHVGHDFEEPLSHIHAHLEGRVEYSLLLYIPKKAPFDLWDRDRKHGVRLYVRRVFIMEGGEEFMPRYLRFVRGVVDSSDLPLNISREILQQNQAVETIRKGTVKKILGMLDTLSRKEADKYKTFWEVFGVVVKEGVVEDMENKDRIAKLLRFASTQDGKKDQTVSLADYVGRMKDGQDKIYYVLGETHNAAKSSPHLEIFRKKGIEVLLLSDRVDEWLATHLNEFDGKTFQSVAQGALDLDKLEETDEETKEARKKTEEGLKDLVERITKTLEAEVQEVRLSHRLTDSPSCLVGADNAMTASMERLLREAGQAVPDSKRILELNPDHALINRLKDESDDGRFGDLCHLLYDQALLAEGGQLEDPAGFVKRMNNLLF